MVPEERGRRSPKRGRQRARFGDKTLLQHAYVAQELDAKRERGPGGSLASEGLEMVARNATVQNTTGGDPVR